MVADYTRTQLWQEGLKRLNFIGFSASADSGGIASTSITDISEFQHSLYGSDEFANGYIWRYNRSGDDMVKRATTLSGATLSHGGSNYSNTSDLDYAYLRIHPDELMSGIQRAARRATLKTLVALCMGTDFDMETGGVNYWNGTSGSSSASNLTPTKSTTDVFSGRQALLLTASGAGAYVRGEKLGASRLSIQAGKSFYSAAILRADVGTVAFSWYDATNAAAVPGETRSYSGEGFVLVERRDTIPPGCEEIQPQFTLTGASDVAVVDCLFGPYTAGQRLFRLQPWLNSSYKIRALRPQWNGISISAGIYDAYSREYYNDLVQPTDFETELFHREVNPYRVQMAPGKSLRDRPTWISAERTQADVSPMTAESDTWHGDLEEIMALVIHEWLKTLVNDHGMLQYKGRLDEYALKTVVEEIADPPLTVRREQYRFRGRL